jgi:CubicO group peptidase (beta-lactamase class C family)
MSGNELAAKVAELAEEHNVVGVAVGVVVDGEEHYAFHGVTSTENPLPVDESTYFQFGSTGKTFTATAIMRLAEQGKVSLDERVRTYLPEFKLKDESVAEAVTVRHLLNHTAGWEGDLMDDTGMGDDALTKYVERMATIEQPTALGETVSYNNASLSVAGLIIERICGKTYEEAIKELLLEPIGLTETLFFPNEIMTRRFVVGHAREDDGTVKISRPWLFPRGNWPAGGMSATARDQITWAKFHLGDGAGADGKQVMKKDTLDLMKQPTADMRGSALGDYVGISWLMRDVDGVRLVGHGGTTNGQYSEFLTVPERNFAIISMTNTGPGGHQLNESLTKWALEHYLGLKDVDPEPLSLSDEELAPYTGTFETIAAICELVAEDGRVLAKVKMKPEMAAILREQGEEDVDKEQPPIPLALLSRDGDAYIVPDGPGKGMRGYFTRGADGTVVGVHVGGRLATRVAAASVSAADPLVSA